jgi:hypothetical protein
MRTEEDIRELARVAQKIEADENGSEVGTSGFHAWCYIFRAMSPEHFARLVAMSQPVLADFLMNDHSNDPAWEEFQDLFNFHEEWSYGELCDRLEKLSDKNMADSRIWEWCLARLPIRRKDYDFLCGLTDDHLEQIAMGGSPQAWGDESRYPEIQAAHPDYNLADFEERLGKVYALWEAHAVIHGESWGEHP